jgi:hypothetical protein
MKQDPATTNGLTRRSFVKRSVVAAVAVSSMTIFSGLVNAQYTQCSSYEFKKEHSTMKDGKLQCYDYVKCDGADAYHHLHECPPAGTEEGDRCRGDTISLRTINQGEGECDPLA